MKPSVREEGAALLSVLLLVAVMGVIATALFDRLRLATNLEANAAGLEQARSFALAAETMITVRIDDLLANANDSMSGDWNGREMRLPLPVGEAHVRVSEAANCFNLNSVVSGDPAHVLTARPRGIEQFVTLMVGIGILDGDARRIANALADWIDSDTTPLPGGIEDEAYVRAETPYLAANTALAETSELRALSGMTPELYAKLRPWVCALPVTDLSPINVNLLTPEQAPLLAMLMPNQLSAEQARAMLEQRPTGGWRGLSDFWALPALEGLVPPADVQSQPRLKPRWLTLDMTLTVGTAELRETALVDAGRAPARVVVRRWTTDE